MKFLLIALFCLFSVAAKAQINNSDIPEYDLQGLMVIQTVNSVIGPATNYSVLDGILNPATNSCIVTVTILGVAYTVPPATPSGPNLPTWVAPPVTQHGPWPQGATITASGTTYCVVTLFYR